MQAEDTRKNTVRSVKIVEFIRYLVGLGHAHLFCRNVNSKAGPKGKKYSHKSTTPLLLFSIFNILWSECALSQSYKPSSYVQLLRILPIHRDGERPKNSCSDQWSMVFRSFLWDYSSDYANNYSYFV